METRNLAPTVALMIEHANEIPFSETMIALVSDQRMQNIFPVLQRGARYRRLILVLSKDRHAGKPAAKYIQAASDTAAALESALAITMSETFVDHADIAVTKAAVSSLLELSGPSSTVVNISGGTKLMAIGALEAARAMGVSSVYTNTENNELIWLDADGTIRLVALDIVGLSVRQYIRAYGEQIISAAELTESNIDRLSQQSWAATIANNHSLLYRKVICPIMELLRNQRRYPLKVNLELSHRQHQIVKHLEEQGLWQWDEATRTLTIANRSAGDFINGGWVEICVASQLQASNLFEDVLRNVKLAGVAGEIDIAAVCNGRLVLIECKSNLQQLQELTKVRVFRDKLGGTFAHAYYACAGEEYAREIRAQCAKLGINGVFFGEELNTIGQQIGKQIRTTL